MASLLLDDGRSNELPMKYKGRAIETLTNLKSVPRTRRRPRQGRVLQTSKVKDVPVRTPVHLHDSDSHHLPNLSMAALCVVKEDDNRLKKDEQMKKDGTSKQMRSSKLSGAVDISDSEEPEKSKQHVDVADGDGKQAEDLPVSTAALSSDMSEKDQLQSVESQQDKGQEVKDKPAQHVDVADGDGKQAEELPVSTAALSSDMSEKNQLQSVESKQEHGTEMKGKPALELQQDEKPVETSVNSSQELEQLEIKELEAVADNDAQPVSDLVPSTALSSDAAEKEPQDELVEEKGPEGIQDSPELKCEPAMQMEQNSETVESSVKANDQLEVDMEKERQEEEETEKPAGVLEQDDEADEPMDDDVHEPHSPSPITTRSGAKRGRQPAWRRGRPGRRRRKASPKKAVPADSDSTQSLIQSTGDESQVLNDSSLVATDNESADLTPGPVALLNESEPDTAVTDSVKKLPGDNVELSETTISSAEQTNVISADDEQKVDSAVTGVEAKDDVEQPCKQQLSVTEAIDQKEVSLETSTSSLEQTDDQKVASVEPMEASTEPVESSTEPVEASSDPMEASSELVEEASEDGKQADEQPLVSKPELTDTKEILSEATVTDVKQPVEVLARDDKNDFSIVLAELANAISTDVELKTGHTSAHANVAGVSNELQHLQRLLPDRELSDLELSLEQVLTEKHAVSAGVRKSGLHSEIEVRDRSRTSRSSKQSDATSATVRKSREHSRPVKVDKKQQVAAGQYPSSKQTVGRKVAGHEMRERITEGCIANLEKHLSQVVQGYCSRIERRRRFLLGHGRHHSRSKRHAERADTPGKHLQLEDISSDEQTLEYRDFGNHCCQLCSGTFKTVFEYLMHLHRHRKNPNKEVTMLYIAKLPAYMSSSDLRRILLPYGEVLSTRIISDQSTEKSCIGLTRMATMKMCEAVIAGFHGKLIHGRKLVVGFALDERMQSMLPGPEHSSSRPPGVKERSKAKTDMSHLKAIGGASGVEFMIHVKEPFYCQLCYCFFPNVDEAHWHLLTADHNENYKHYIARQHVEVKASRGSLGATGRKQKRKPLAAAAGADSAVKDAEKPRSGTDVKESGRISDPEMGAIDISSDDDDVVRANTDVPVAASDAEESMAVVKLVCDELLDRVCGVPVEVADKELMADMRLICDELIDRVVALTDRRDGANEEHWKPEVASYEIENMTETDAWWPTEEDKESESEKVKETQIKRVEEPIELYSSVSSDEEEGDVVVVSAEGVKTDADKVSQPAAGERGSEIYISDASSGTVIMDEVEPQNVSMGISKEQDDVFEEYNAGMDRSREVDGFVQQSVESYMDTSDGVTEIELHELHSEDADGTARQSAKTEGHFPSADELAISISEFLSGLSDIEPCESDENDETNVESSTKEPTIPDVELVQPESMVPWAAAEQGEGIDSSSMNIEASEMAAVDSQEVQIPSESSKHWSCSTESSHDLSAGSHGLPADDQPGKTCAPMAEQRDVLPFGDGSKEISESVTEGDVSTGRCGSSASAISDASDGGQPASEHGIDADIPTAVDVGEQGSCGDDMGHALSSVTEDAIADEDDFEVELL